MDFKEGDILRHKATKIESEAIWIVTNIGKKYCTMTNRVSGWKNNEYEISFLTEEFWMTEIPNINEAKLKKALKLT